LRSKDIQRILKAEFGNPCSLGSLITCYNNWDVCGTKETHAILRKRPGLNPSVLAVVVDASLHRQKSLQDERG
jgi:hypothetical protein